MHSITKTDVKGPVFGLFLMTIFTLIWGLIAEISLHNLDHRILGAIYLLVTLSFLANYIRAVRFMSKLPEQTSVEIDPQVAKRKKQFLIVTTLEGVGIGASNILLSTFHLEGYIIPCLALIIGLHFFPLSKIFGSKLHLYIGCYTTSIALTGVVLTYFETMPVTYISTFVCICCSFSTIIFAISFINFINNKRRLAEA